LLRFDQHRRAINPVRQTAKFGLPALSWYQSTRHTFASHWVLGGGSIERLRDIMGHSSVVTTERYAHLKPDLFRESAYDTVRVDLSKPAAVVVSLPSPQLEKEQRLTSDETQEVKEAILTA
jgi:hypothetical protein